MNEIIKDPRSETQIQNAIQKTEDLYNEMKNFVDRLDLRLDSKMLNI